MNDVKHTPGPWEASGQLILTSQLYPHANPRAQHEPNIIGEVHWDYDGDHGAKESRIGWTEAAANQQLMIQSPVLLKTLQEAYRVLAESHMENGELHWVTPGETLLERLSNVIEDTTGQKPPLPSPSA
jgi:hypothetical protein